MERYEEIKDIFGSLPEFRKASKIFWSYRVSPLFQGEVPIKTDHFAYYFAYRDFIRSERFYKAK